MSRQLIELVPCDAHDCWWTKSILECLSGWRPSEDRVLHMHVDQLPCNKQSEAPAPASSDSSLQTWPAI